MALQSGAPFTIKATLEGKKQDSFVLTMRIVGGTEDFNVVEDTAWYPFKNHVLELRCPVGKTRRALQIASGYRVTHVFTWDCSTGMIEAGGQD